MKARAPLKIQSKRSKEERVFVLKKNFFKVTTQNSRRVNLRFLRRAKFQIFKIQLLKTIFGKNVPLFGITIQEGGSRGTEIKVKMRKNW